MRKNLTNLTREFFDCLQNWDYEKIKSMCHPNISWTVNAPIPFGGTYNGINEVFRLFKKLENEFPAGLSFTFEKIITEHPFCAVEWNDEGKRKNGLFYKNKGMSFIKYSSEGKIQQISEIVDSYSFLNLS